MATRRVKMTTVDPDRLRRAFRTARDALLAERAPEGHWVGELSTSALSTAVAVSALSMADREAHARLIAGGLGWLAAHRTALGALPEKVRADGAPAAVAPLAWTSALAVLALAELDPGACGR